MIVIIMLLSIICIINSLAIFSLSKENKKYCEHNWKQTSEEKIYDPFCYNTIKHKKIILTCKHCGELKIKNIY